MHSSTGRPTLNLLVAVDGSAHAQAVLRWLASLAQIGLKPRCMLNHVQRPILSGEVGVIAPAEVAVSARDRHTHSVLEDAVQVLCRVGMLAKTVTLTASDIPTALLVCAREQACDAIVVGRRGQGALRAALLGSVSAGVVHHAALPVIVINRDVQPASLPLRIVLATDGSPAADRAAAMASRLAAQTPGGEVHALYVRPDMTLAETLLGPTDRLIEQWSSADETQVLERTREIVVPEGAAYAAFPAVAGDPNTVILHAADTLNAGTIAMGTRGLAPVSSVLAGSVAQQVLRHARVPVLLTR